MITSPRPPNRSRPRHHKKQTVPCSRALIAGFTPRQLHRTRINPEPRCELSSHLFDLPGSCTISLVWRRRWHWVHKLSRHSFQKSINLKLRHGQRKMVRYSASVHSMWSADIGFRSLWRLFPTRSSRTAHRAQPRAQRTLRVRGLSTGNRDRTTHPAWATGISQVGLQVSFSCPLLNTIIWPNRWPMISGDRLLPLLSVFMFFIYLEPRNTGAWIVTFDIPSHLCEIKRPRLTS